jgi:hypothetical protein
MLLLFDIEQDSVAEHDDWHTHEHMPERLGIPGFLCGTRWIAVDPGPRYCVLYEVAELAVLDSPAYRDRLDHPTPATSAMMRKYLGMRRALCSVEARSGLGMGSSALVVCFAPEAGREDELDDWLATKIVPGLSQRPGIASCCLLRNALAARMTREQAIRGPDDTLHSALFVTGYDETIVTGLARHELAAERLVVHGVATNSHAATAYRQAYALTA